MKHRGILLGIRISVFHLLISIYCFGSPSVFASQNAEPLVSFAKGIDKFGDRESPTKMHCLPPSSPSSQTIVSPISEEEKSITQELWVNQPITLKDEQTKNAQLLEVEVENSDPECLILAVTGLPPRTASGSALKKRGVLKCKKLSHLASVARCLRKAFKGTRRALIIWMLKCLALFKIPWAKDTLFKIKIAKSLKLNW
ncbi:hypothetical protein O181_004080 [Austropuccinia psidii MF-1]|uniref:Uncharacterized protein n=1 Tax=Austropuccinia psidii MF-1 TaxID=1389203 RepID=A0A9Q3GEI9_9BASI|nr:hypothetical protein [Austropuccinia psidii MF-1]